MGLHGMYVPVLLHMSDPSRLALHTTTHRPVPNPGIASALLVVLVSRPRFFSSPSLSLHTATA